MQTVNLMPPAFEASNPNSQQNIAKANKAARDMDIAINSKLSFLADLIQFIHSYGKGPNLHSILYNAMRASMMGDDLAQMNEEAKELAERWDSLQDMHTKATNDLINAVAGR